MPEHRHRLSQACHNAASLGLARNAVARNATEVMTSRVQQAQRPETDVDDPLAARSAPSPAPTLADVASCPKQEPCESIRITT
jgi:hypothetical protein